MTTTRHGWKDHNWVWQDTSHADGVRVTSYLCECGKTKKVVTVIKKRVKKQQDATPKPPRKPQNRLSQSRHSKPAKKGKDATESKCVRKTRLKPVSAKRSGQLRKYQGARLRFLKGHPYCEICEHNFSTQIHHKKHREGELLLDEEFWIALCGICHTWVHDQPERSREQGYLL